MSLYGGQEIMRITLVSSIKHVMETAQVHTLLYAHLHTTKLQTSSNFSGSQEIRVTHQNFRDTCLNFKAMVHDNVYYY